MTKPIIYDHQYGVCVINGLLISAWSDAADAFSLAPVDPSAAITQGINGVVVNFTGKESQALTLKLLPDSPEDRAMRAIFKSQQDAKTYKMIDGTFLDTINGTSITMTGGSILTDSTFSRGNAYNEAVWVITFSKVDKT